MGSSARYFDVENEINNRKIEIYTPNYEQSSQSPTTSLKSSIFLRSFIIDFGIDYINNFLSLNIELKVTNKLD